MKVIGKGAEAVLTFEKLHDQTVVCKHRMKKEYRCVALDESIRTKRTRNEAKIMREACSNGVNCAKLLKCDEVGKKIYFTLIDGIVLEEKNVSDKELTQSGEQLAKLHATGIIHGDFTTSNLMSDGKTVFVIDFGLSEFSAKDEGRATDFLLMYKSIDDKKFEHFVYGYEKIAGKKQAKLVFDRMKKILARGRNA